MIQRTIAMILIPAFLISASGCARVVTKPASEMRLLSARQQSSYEIRMLTLKDDGLVTFDKYMPARLSNGLIEAKVPVAGLDIPKEGVGSIKRNRWGEVTEISTSDGSLYRILRSAEEADRFRIEKGYLMKVIDLADVSFFNMVKPNAGASFLGLSVIIILGFLASIMGSS